MSQDTPAFSFRLDNVCTCIPPKFRQGCRCSYRIIASGNSFVPFLLLQITRSLVRRRNRTTQSCLNCHATKRMCDRERPCCTRCLQLGISGNCVYEVDDPNRQAGKQGEGSRLMNRIVELEGVIREVNFLHRNKYFISFFISPVEEQTASAPRKIAQLR
ncbi:hypothetical protein DFH06DRAFT_1009067 [Mycena polygramma]|nr:hypothetical protein DFH06DRAFT_1009067 [Mycena polygramma]